MPLALAEFRILSLTPSQFHNPLRLSPISTGIKTTPSRTLARANVAVSLESVGFDFGKATEAVGGASDPNANARRCEGRETELAPHVGVPGDGPAWHCLPLLAV